MFDVQTLNDFPLRYLLIAEACLPFFIVFIIGNLFIPASDGINGRPKSWVFAIVWVLLVVMWTLGLVVTAMDEPSCLTASLVGSFSFVALLMCVVWLISHKLNPAGTASPQVLLVATAMMVATTVCSLNGSAPEDSKTLVTTFYSFIATWLGAATLFNYLEIN